MHQLPGLVVGLSFSKEVLGRSYRGYSELRTHTALGPYGRSVPRTMTFLGAVRVLNFE